MDKEKLIVAGKELKDISHKEYKVKKDMDIIINELGNVSYRETADRLIQECLVSGIDIQELIDVLNGPDEDRKKAVQYFVMGYTSK